MDFGALGLPYRLWCEPNSAKHGVGRKAPGLSGKVSSGLDCFFFSFPGRSLGLFSGRQANVCTLCSGFGAQE